MKREIDASAALESLLTPRMALNAEKWVSFSPDYVNLSHNSERKGLISSDAADALYVQYIYSDGDGLIPNKEMMRWICE